MYYGGYMQQDSGVERIVLADQFIVSKTDLRGVITYANQYFMDISKSRNELDWSPRVNFTEGLGKVHSWIEANFDDLSASSLEYRHAH